jgi:guanylate kinase
MRQFPQALTIFLKTASDAEYEQRLRHRGTDAEDVIQQRLASARRELEHAAEYSFQVVNSDLDTAVDEIVGIITSWETRTHA